MAWKEVHYTKLGYDIWIGNTTDEPIWAYYYSGIQLEGGKAGVEIAEGVNFFSTINFYHKGDGFYGTFANYLWVEGYKEYTYIWGYVPAHPNWTFVEFGTAAYLGGWEGIFKSHGLAVCRSIDTKKEIWLGYQLPPAGFDYLIASDGDADVYHHIAPEASWIKVISAVPERRG